MIRVLIISPHFPPTNAADMQRVRLVLPYLREADVECEVLAVEAAQVASPVDPWLSDGMPSELSIHRVRAMGLRWTRIPALGTLSLRCERALRRKGNQLLNSGRFDLIYFSTTQFGIHRLGPHWKEKSGIPFVMDYQDPWVSDYYRQNPEVLPPGGRFKYGVADWLNRRQEPKVLRECCGITSVSAAYPEQLAKRYSWLKIEEVFTVKTQRAQIDAEKREELAGLRPPASDLRPLPSLVVPFPGDSRDLERVRKDKVKQSVFDPDDGMKHWVYVGRGGADMQKAAGAIFHALCLHSNANPEILASLRIHFIGTSYAAAGSGRKTLEGLADSMGLGGVVTEHTDRIPYSQAMRCLLDADALIVPGSDDPGYTASKIYPYLLAEKPLLAVFHEESSVVSLIRRVGGGTVVGFVTGESAGVIGRRIAETAFDQLGQIKKTPLDLKAFEPHTAQYQAKELGMFFSHCLAIASSCP